MTDDFPDHPPGADEVAAAAAALDADHEPGAALINASFVGTAVLVVAGAAGAAAPDDLGGLTAAASLVLFAIGVGAFLYGYGVGVTRSREEKITLGGLFFLSGTAPKDVRTRLRVTFGIQVVVAVVVASIRPYTSVAFAVLAPIFGMGIMAAWAARFGTFFAKDDADERRAAPAARPDDDPGPPDEEG